jgi:hypothetical protein
MVAARRAVTEEDAGPRPEEGQMSTTSTATDVRCSLGLDDLAPAIPR